MGTIPICPLSHFLEALWYLWYGVIVLCCQETNDSVIMKLSNVSQGRLERSGAPYQPVMSWKVIQLRIEYTAGRVFSATVWQFLKFNSWYIYVQAINML